MNVSESIIKGLENLGVDTVFGGSGQSDGDLLFALQDISHIKTVITRHEQAASFMACGYAMFSDKLGVCITTAGPGAVNLISGLCVAYSDSLPVLGIVGYVTAAGKGRGDLGETSGLNRTPDSTAMFSACTKRTFTVERPGCAAQILEEAVNLAYAGRPGPVVIQLPYDISNMSVENYKNVNLNIAPVMPSQKKITQFADVLADAIKNKKKILAWLGYGCIRSHAEKDILAFLEKFQIPFVTTMDAKGILPENHPLSVGMMGVAGEPGAKQTFKDSDVIFALGTSFVKWSCWMWRKELFDNKTLMHINIEREALGRVYEPDYSMVSNIKPAVAGIMEELSKKVTTVNKPHMVIDKYAFRNVEHTGSKIHPAHLVREISQNLPEKAIILGDAGGHMLWLGGYLHLTKWQNYHNPGSFGPMASHVNASIGMQCANPDRRVIVACGDGDYQMAGFELMTAVENKIPLVWVIFNNSEFNVIKFLQMRTHSGKQVFNDFLNPDFAAYAKACGALGYRIEKISDFAPAFREAIASNRPAVLDVIIESGMQPPFVAYNE